VDVLALLKSIRLPEGRYVTEVKPGIHAFGADRPMSRVRSYQTKGLPGMAGRGMSREFLLLAHVHVDAARKVTLIEGFNGGEGQRAAEAIRAALAQAGLAEGARFEPTQPLKACPASGFS